MAISFKNTKGAAQKSVKYFKLEEGENRFRMVGLILPRYVYWKKNNAGKSLSVECLSFDRDKEQFTNLEKDWFQEYFPEEKCSWSYLVSVLDPKDGEVKVLGLRKKLFEQILLLSEDLGDPTDLDTGWEVVVKKTKTGSSKFNVEYQLMQMRCKVSALTDEQKAVVSEAKSLDELIPRQTPEEQKKFIMKNFVSREPEVSDEQLDEDVAKGFDDDTPF